jgi:hypothetical protein
MAQAMGCNPRPFQGHYQRVSRNRTETIDFSGSNALLQISEFSLFYEARNPEP